MNILKSIGAILAGLIAIVIVTTLIDVIMHATGIFPPWFTPMSTGLWFVALGYRIATGIMGGYITARLAPDRPVGHALILGLIGIVLSTFATIATWSQGPEFGPKWYPISLIIIALPCAWLGGKLKTR